MAKLIKRAQVSAELFYLNQVETTVDDNLQTNPLLPKEIVDEAIIKQMQADFYQQGLIDGRALADNEKLAMQAQLENLLSSIPQAIADNRLQLHAEIADVVLHIARQLFVNNQLSQTALSDQINALLVDLNNKHNPELHLHPQHIAAMQAGHIQIKASHLNGLKIKSNESLQLGGCLVKTDHGVFDASIEKQIDRLKDVLLQMKQRGLHATLE